MRAVTQSVAFPAANVPRWTEYGPAFESLAAAPWIRRLRNLRIQSGHHGGLFGLLGERLFGGADAPPAEVIPDAAVLTLAAAVSTDKLERLVLPAAVINLPVRESLISRLKDRVAFT